MTARRLRAGLIGCGNIGLYHARAAAADPRLELVAYADARPEAARTFLAEHGGRYATADTGELIGDDGIDIVIIATHHDSHAALALAAAGAGRHILLEKPMATSVADALAIRDAVLSAGVSCAINYKFRLDQPVRQARDSMPAPCLAVVQLAMGPIGPASDDHWVYDPVRGGGLVMSTGTHLLDLLCWVCRSEPAACSGSSSVVADRPAGLADITVSSVEFESGALGSVVLADVGENAALSKWSCQIYDGTSSVVLTGRLQVATYSAGPPPAPRGPAGLPGSMLGSLADAVLTGSPVAADVHDGVRAVKLAAALADAAASGQRVLL
ncbi:MAG TPA: Gfo/Idh/MocA family oxidoreductase [Streptosporangiaceae bacterium]|jgi:predicted dehydrogenase